MKEMLILKRKKEKKIMENKDLSATKFLWSDKEDEELYRNGITIIWVAGRTKSIQNFVEKLSYKIGYKCDFSFTAGRAHIDVFKEAYDKAVETINDDDFMKEFIVPYTKETYDNETYFEIIG